MLVHVLEHLARLDFLSSLSVSVVARRPWATPVGGPVLYYRSKVVRWESCLLEKRACPLSAVAS